MIDLPMTTAFGAMLLAGVGVGEALRAWAGWAPEASRRAVHVITGVLVALCPLWFDAPGGVYLLAVSFVVVNVWAVPRGVFGGMHGIRRRSWGTVIFPLALLLALVGCWSLDGERVFALQAAFLALGLADPAASWAGGRWGTRRFRIGRAEKSWAGSAACFVVAFAAVAFVLVLSGQPLYGHWAGAALVAASLATAAEGLGGEGWDNLGIVVAVATPLVALHEGASLALLLGALGLAMAFSWMAYRVRFLDASGALAAGLLAFGVVGLGGWAWAVPGFVFFLTGSLLSKARERFGGETAVRAEKGSRRDAAQVVSNGGVAGALLVVHVFWPWGGLYWGFAAAFAAAAADTWATEVGTWRRGPTRLVWSGRRVPAGTSGGVSLAGTAGALLGAAVVFGSLVPFAGPYVGGLGWGWAAVAVVGGGFLAALVDSALGATLQARYRDGSGAIVEVRPAPDAVPVRGVRWLDNDRVNLACTLAGGLLGVGALLAFHAF